MAKSSTTIDSEIRASLPPRGRSNRTKLLEAIREESLIGLTPSSTQDEAEKAHFLHIAKRAYDGIDDKDSGMLLKHLGDKCWPNLKPTMENVNFDFDPSATPSVQSQQVLKAAADGIIPPDIASVFIGSIASMLKIEEVTEIKERLDKLEELLKNNG